MYHAHSNQFPLTRSKDSKLTFEMDALIDDWCENGNFHKATDIMHICIALSKLRLHISQDEENPYDESEYSEITPDLIHKLHDLYFTQDRFYKYLTDKVKKNDGHFPPINKTKALKEFLARGFGYKDCLQPVAYRTGWTIKAHIGGLVWPNYYESQADAYLVFEKVGIPGLTGIYKPIDKNFQ